jgi:aldehyde dehydrogenase (NAD+)
MKKEWMKVATTVTEEMGAPLWLSQVAQATTGLSHFKGTLKTLENYEFERNSENYIERKEAIGVVGMITPWNWPMNQMCTKVASAIAAGCTMVLKPSEISPYCAILLAEIIDEAGLPKGVFQFSKWIWTYSRSCIIRKSRCRYDFNHRFY